MKTFKEMSEEYSDLLESAIFKKVKKWKPDANGKLVKVLVKQCQDADGKKVPGYKVVGGKKCEKMSGSERLQKTKTAKKVIKAKKRNSGKLAARAKKIMQQKIAKGLIDKPILPKDED